MNNLKTTIAVLLAALLLLVANASERVVYAFSEWPFLVRVGMGIVAVIVVIMILLHAFDVINIYRLIFGR